MEAIEMLKDNLASAHRGYFNAREATDQQLHFVPENGSHSIAWCVWHTARMEDNLAQCYRETDPRWNED
ncbi:MAG TPA: DinB family protein [Acidobacteriota bacterium]|jgi:hypothetical protein|nr:DinB family protein [Acidobacteriota bacterium]